jgi:sugar lactone lactonase YvrE
MTEPTIFAEKLSAPEGPVVGPAGWMLNVCSFDPKDPGWPRKAGDITATHQSEPLVTRTVFNTSTEEVTGIPAALAFGPDGCLYVTDEGRRSIVRVTGKGEIADFITYYQGEKINGPNDLCFDEDGNLFFTDPWGSSLNNPIGAVYGYEWDTGTLFQIHDGLAFPNGIIVRNGLLYAAETQTSKIWLYDITGPGRAEKPRVFCKLPEVEPDESGWTGPDGMKFDNQGNIYIAALGKGAGVYVYNPEGELLDTINTGGSRTTNLCFGGPDFNTLYVTVDDLGAMVTIPVGVEGYRLPFCPSGWQGEHPWAEMLSESPAS